MDISWIGFIIFIASFLAGRFISVKALKILNEDERRKLISEFSTYNIVNMVCVVLLVVVYFAIPLIIPNKSAVTEPIFIGAFVTYLIGSTFYAYVKLKKLKMPENYVNQFLFSNFVQYLGLFIAFGIIINAK